MNTQILFNQKENYLDYKKNELLEVIKEFNINNAQEKLNTIIDRYNRQIDTIFKTGLDIGILTKNIVKIIDIVKYNNDYYFYSKNKKLYYIDMIN